MRRDIILIGVSSAPAFPPLKSVGGCIAAMRDWARAQRIDASQIVEVTDLEREPVTLLRITKEIFRLEEGAATDQIIIYFAGHGLVGAKGDLWLLTGAPRDQTAVVSLDVSRKDALRSSFPHIVMISDACRSAARGLQGVFLNGQSIFPNSPEVPGRQARQVDQFFASTVGEPALEIKRPQGYVSIYTEALAQALGGGVTSLLEEETPGTSTPVVIRPWPLADHLPLAVSRWIESNHLKLSQPTDAVLGSRPTAWLAEFDGLPPASLPGGGSPVLPPGDEPGGLDLPKNPMTTMRPPVALNTSTALRNNLRYAARARVQVSLWSSQPGRSGARPGTRCGFRVLGSYITGAWTTPGSHVESGSHSSDVRVASDGPAGVVLQFESGRGAFLPALPGFVGYIRFDAIGMIRSVAYELSADNRRAISTGRPRIGSPGGRAFDLRASAMHRVRGVLEAAFARGDLRMGSLGGIGREELLRCISHRGGVDLTSAVLAAYGLYGSRDQEIIPELIKSVLATYRCVPVDLLMLGSSGGEASPPRPFQAGGPPFPIVTRGWPLMKSFGWDLPQELAGLGSHLAESPWTLVDAEGVEMLRRYVTRSSVRMARRIESEGTTYA